jgi:hypothetical protein
MISISVKGALLWLVGIPLPIILLIALYKTRPTRRRTNQPAWITVDGGFATASAPSSTFRRAARGSGSKIRNSSSRSFN